MHFISVKKVSQHAAAYFGLSTVSMVVYNNTQNSFHFSPFHVVVPTSLTCEKFDCFQSVRLFSWRKVLLTAVWHISVKRIIVLLSEDIVTQTTKDTADRPS